MKQTSSRTLAPLDAMPFEREIRSSAQRSMTLHRQVDQLFELMRDPLLSDFQAKARLEALEEWRAKAVFSSGSTGGDQKSAASSGVPRRPPSSKLI